MNFMHHSTGLPHYTSDIWGTYMMIWQCRVVVFLLTFEFEGVGSSVTITELLHLFRNESKTCWEEEKNIQQIPKEPADGEDTTSHFFLYFMHVFEHFMLWSYTKMHAAHSVCFLMACFILQTVFVYELQVAMYYMDKPDQNIHYTV